MRRIPPLNALIAFEATARLGGVRAASDELNVTQSAVSHQIANLENYLETALFHRRNRRMFLTEVGSDYFKQIEPAMEAIIRASAHAERIAHGETLTISAPPSLTATWLLARLQKFVDAHPDLNIRFLERMVLNPEEKLIDCAIEYRYQESQDFKSILLLHDEVAPIASPKLVNRHKIHSVEDLRGVTLIQTDRRLISWKAILGSMPWYRTQKIFSFSYSLHAFQAAELSLGVALGNRYNAERYIKEGSLCVPFEFKPGEVPPTPRYFFSSTAQKARLPKVIAFSDWITKEARPARNEPCSATLDREKVEQEARFDGKWIFDLPFHAIQLRTGHEFKESTRQS